MEVKCLQQYHRIQISVELKRQVAAEFDIKFSIFRK